jgi:hypothetical protein
MPTSDVDTTVLVGYVNGVERNLDDVYDEILKLYNVLIEKNAVDLGGLKLLDQDEVSRSYVFSLLCSFYGVISENDDAILPVFSDPSIIEEKTTFEPYSLMFYLISPFDDATDEIANDFYESRKMLGLEEKEFTLDNLFDFIVKDLGIIFAFIPESIISGDYDRELMLTDLTYEAVSKVNYYKAVVDADEKYSFVKPDEILEQFPELKKEKLDESFCAFWRGVRNTIFFISTLRNGELPADDFITNDDIFKVDE